MLFRRAYATVLDCCSTKPSPAFLRYNHIHAASRQRFSKDDKLSQKGKKRDGKDFPANGDPESLPNNNNGKTFQVEMLDGPLGSVVSTAKTLIDAAASRNAKFFHQDGRELQAKIGEKNKPYQHVASLEKLQFMGDESQKQAHASDDDAFLADSATRDFHPGTFVEVRRNNIVTFGVVIRIEVLDVKLHALTLTQSGEVWPHLLSDITYSIPNFVPLDVIQHSGNGLRAANPHETSSRLRIVEKIRSFARQHEQQFNSQGVQFRDIYEQIHHPDPERWTDITTTEMVRRWDPRKPPPILTIFAAHSHMMEDPLHYVADPINHRISQQFSIRPKAQVETIQTVNEWVRHRDPAFQSFIDKTKDIIATTRRIRKMHGDGPPRDMKIDLLAWSKTDLVLVKYLKSSLRTHRSLQRDPYDISLPNVIKGIGLEPGEMIDASVVRRILCDLGVLAPWDDVVMRNPDLRADMTPLNEAKDHKALSALVRFNIQHTDQSVPPDFKQTFVDLHLPGSMQMIHQDPWADVRHDFGRLPVYVVDDESAQELDDGLSLEPVTDEPSNYWVHVHVADPTTRISPGHVLDTFAQTQATTIYSKHRTWPMLPEAFGSLFSLGSRGEGNTQEVLTFSIKLSKDGEILDTRIVPGIVRNVKVMSYDQVGHALGLSLGDRLYPFGNISADKQVYSTLPNEQISDLKQLYELSTAVMTRQVQDTNSFHFSWAVADVGFASPIPPESRDVNPIAWAGYPKMTYHVEHDKRDTYRNVIAQFMILACRAASRFCVEHGLPALRRSNQRPLCEPSALEEVLKKRSNYGIVDPIEAMKHNVFPKPSELALTPDSHWALGIPEGEGYVRVTSPLRRYVDIVMHWQIKHALLPVSQRTQKALFPSQYLYPLGLRLHKREKLARKADELYKRHWAIAYLAQRIEGERKKHGPSHNPFPKLVVRTAARPVLDPLEMTGQVVVYSEFLGLRGHLKGVDRYSDIPIGTRFPVQISRISLGLTPRLEFTHA